MAPRRRGSRSSPDVPATPARRSSRIRGLPATPIPDLDSIPRPSTRRRARAPARRSPTLPPPPPSSSPRSDPQKRQTPPSTAATQQHIASNSLQPPGSSPALVLQPRESSSDSDSDSSSSESSESAHIASVPLSSASPQEPALSPSRPSPSFSRSSAPSPPESHDYDTSQGYEETEPGSPIDQSVITGGAESGDDEPDYDEPDLINKDHTPTSDVHFDVVDFFDNISPRHSRERDQPASDSNDERMDNPSPTSPDDAANVDAPADARADDSTDERRRYVRLKLAMQRRPDERPQDIELHIYDDWPQPTADGAIILTFEGKPETTQDAGNNQQPRGHDETSGGRRAIDAPTSYPPSSQKRSRDAEDEGDGHDSGSDGAPRTPKRRQVSHMSATDGEGQQPAMFGEPTNTFDLGHVDLDEDDQEDGSVPAEPIVREANNTRLRSVIDRLQSICRKIRQSFSHLPAIAASIRDLPRRGWNAILSQAARLLRAVPRGRLAITAGMITAVAVAIYFARDSSVPMPKFKALDYFEQTDMLFQLYSAVPHVLVLGELDVVEQVKNLYGLELNTNPVLNGQLANTTDFQPRGEPWSQDADGNYVPEPVFVHSLSDAVHSFFQEKLMYLGAGLLQPNKTPAPASREHPPCRHLVEADPSLDLRMVGGVVRSAMNAFVVEYARTVSRMHKPETNGMGAVERHLSVRKATLDKIGRSMRHASSDYGGTDAERLACLRERERDPSAPTVDCDGGFQGRLLFPWRQLENQTATDILAISTCHLNRFALADSQCVKTGSLPVDDLGPYIRPYQKAIQDLIPELRGLRERLIGIHDEIYRLPPPAHQCIDAEVSRTCTVNCVIREIEKMVFFLDRIAIPRLESMQRRAEISTMILDKADSRRVRLSDKLFPLTSTFEEDRWVYWLPSWPDLQIPALPSVDSISYLTEDSQDQLQIRREDFEKRVAQSKKSDAKYKSNDKEKWFHNCSDDCTKSKPLPQVLPKDHQDFLYKTTATGGSQTAAGGTKARPEAEGTTSAEWWEKIFRWIGEQDRG